MAVNPSLVTSLLRTARAGDRAALDRAVAIVYDELRRIARRIRRTQGDTMNTTALVHEAYVRLAGAESEFIDRTHFLAVAATAMRHVLIDHARTRQSQRRGGRHHFVDLHAIEHLIGTAAFEDVHADALVALDAALARLARHSTRQVQIVECRFFAGMTIPETATALGISEATVKRGWSMAQAWLYRELKAPETSSEPAQA